MLNCEPVQKRPTVVARMSRLIASLEDGDYPIHYYLFTLCAAIALRNCLEILVAQNVTEIFWYTPLHYSFFYFSLFLNIVLLLKFMAKTDVIKAVKTTMAGFIIIATVPIIDVLLQHLWNYEIMYLYMIPERTPNIWLNYALFFGDHKGATPGMRIEILAAMMASALYVRIKTGSVLRGALTAFLLYSIIFWGYGAILFLITGLERSLDIPLETSYRTMIDCYMFLSLHSLLLLAYLFKPGYVKAIMRDLRLTRVLHYILMVIFGIALAYSNSGQPFGSFPALLELYFLVASVVFSCIYSAITNNIVDIGIDRVTNPDRPTVTGIIPENDYRMIGYVALFLALACSLAAGFQIALLVCGFIGNYFLYSMPPLRLKRVTFFSKGLIALNCLFMILAGYCFAGSKMPLFPPDVAAFVIICFTACINFIDIKDYQGDMAEGVITLPVLLGLKKSKLLIGAFFVIGYAVFPYYFELPALLIPSVLIGLAIFCIINVKKYREGAVFGLYLASAVLLLGYLAHNHHLL